MQPLIFILTIAIVGSAQTKSSPATVPANGNAKDQTVEQLRRQVSGLQAELTYLNIRVLALNNSLETVNARLLLAESQINKQIAEVSELKHGSAQLDPADPNAYYRIDTKVGPLLVLLANAQPYLDGCKVELQIGNPLAVTFSGFEVMARWNTRYIAPADDQFLSWKKNEKSKTFQFTQNLSPLHWSKVELVLPQTKAEDFGYLSVSVAVHNLSLD
jgi:hypothetical protein